jgi:steroid 5-alpha reductase family enzyme
MTRALSLVAGAYLLAGAVGVGVGFALRGQPPLVAVGAADLAATVVVFSFSLLARNSSIYDPYWSVAPVAIALFWLARPGSSGLADPRHVLIFALVCLWAARLTGNWLTQWRGLGHEDWRYRQMQQQTGAWYWPVSFLGIHLMPTILVFLGCLALWPTLSDSASRLTWLDGVAALITLAAIATEATADYQMRRFRRTEAAAQGATPPGLWSLSRHPNYFGEVLFWWGLYLFVPPAYPGLWWVIVGPVAITLLFLGVSIPLMERHLLAEHPAYAAYQQRVPAFFPWPARALSVRSRHER